MHQCVLTMKTPKVFFSLVVRAWSGVITCKPEETWPSFEVYLELDTSLKWRTQHMDILASKLPYSLIDMLSSKLNLFFSELTIISRDKISILITQTINAIYVCAAAWKFRTIRGILVPVSWCLKMPSARCSDWFGLSASQMHYYSLCPYGFWRAKRSS